MGRRKTKKERVALKREKMQLRRALKHARMKSGQELNDAKVTTEREIGSHESEIVGRGLETPGREPEVGQELKSVILESKQRIEGCEPEIEQDLKLGDVESGQALQSPVSETRQEPKAEEKKAGQKSKAEEISTMILGLLYLIIAVMFPLPCGYIFYSSLMDKSCTMFHVFLATLIFFLSFVLLFFVLVYLLIPIHWQMKEERRRLRNKERQG
jgi:hypothetical protein